MSCMDYKKPNQIIVGVDEAGRGPLAGPVAVAAVSMSRSHLAKFTRGVISQSALPLRDSKKLSAAARGLWFSALQKARHAGEIDFSVALVGEKIIDSRGIVYAVRLGVRRVLNRLKIGPSQSQILLDGSLRAPAKYRKQKTIIRGDNTVPIIMLSAIAAKVRRDRRMIGLAKRYPGYGLEIHKGYGTSDHYRALKRLGISPIHRRSFL